MAMTCTNGVQPCAGCTNCQQGKIKGECVICQEDVLTCEDHYDLQGDMVHEDCLRDWARRYLVFAQ